jgi:hypothetical protein
LHFETHKQINSVWNNEELSQQFKESIAYRINTINKKGDKTECRDSNYRDASLSPTSYNILSYIPPSSLSRQADEIIGVHHCGFISNRSITDHVFFILQILEKKWEYNETVHQLIIRFKKAHDAVKWKVLCNTLIELGVPMD